MKFFELSREVEPEYVGLRDGTLQLSGSEIFEQNNQQYHQIFKLEGKLNPQFWWKKWNDHRVYAAYPVTGLELKEKARLTDYMEFHLRGFYVSRKLKLILEQFNLPPHTFQPTEILIKKNRSVNKDYYWFAYDFYTGEAIIDFKKSEFVANKYGHPLDMKVTVDSYADFMEVFFTTGVSLNAKKIVFNSKFDKDNDLFSINFLLTKPLISSRLLKELENAGVTGFIARSPEVMKQRAEKFGDLYTELVFE